MLLEKTTLGNLSIDNKGNYGIAASAVDFSNELYTYLRITDITDDGRINLSDLKSVDDENAENYILKPNDIVFARTGGSTGRNYFYDGTDGVFVYAGFLIKFSIDPNKVNPRFIKYYCQSPKYKNWVNSYNTGSTRGNINAQTYANMEIELPPREYQDLIVPILDAIENKITVNNSTNNNLEQQAQAIYKSWFVDFEPFDGTMPDNWQYVQLDTVAEFVGGYSYKGNELQPSNYAMATIKNFERKGGFKLDGYKEIIPSDKCKNEQEAKLYDILVAHTDLTQNADVIGNAELLLCTDKYEKIVFSMDVVKVIPKNNMPHFILATMLKSKEFKSHCLGYVNGTTVLHLSKKALPDYIISIPKDLNSLSKLEESLKNIYTLISNNLNENIKLTQLRDTLLPKLMSGEIDVSNVDISTDKLSFSCLNVLIEKTYIYKILNIINYNLLIYNKYLEFAHLLQQLMLSFL